MTARSDRMRRGRFLSCRLTSNTPENLLKFWQENIATQADHEPDKESVVVVMMNTRPRP